MKLKRMIRRACLKMTVFSFNNSMVEKNYCNYLTLSADESQGCH